MGDATDPRDAKTGKALPRTLTGSVVIGTE
jgi:hypothetical protein